MIRKYDLAVIEALKIKVDTGDIPINVATPRREFGTQEEMTGQDPTKPGENPVANKTVRYPAMAVTRLSWNPAEDRQNFARHRKLGYTDDLNQIYQAQHPLAWDIHYQLDIYAKYRDDLNILTAFTIIKFPKKRKMISVDLGHPWGNRKIELFIGNMIDNSGLEGDENEDRICRATFDAHLNAWLPIPPIAVRTVREVIMRTEIDWFQPGRGLDMVVSDVVVEEG